VYAFTHGTSKVDDIKKMGADHVIVTDDVSVEQLLRLRTMSETLSMIIGRKVR
jgi:D-arabinose 1-dehydrogenase-like Zn-dependent alcohol dehydrogenase